ncbi:MAG: flavodoxin family protein [Eubacteriales bacterium]|nr:flavodoxin family protein [Eubacteriales bacterium]MDD4513037.1 flavodoxin family protein [Eubacteriales bacterium]
MNIKVMYHSSTGNTEKLAKAIADTVNAKAEPIGSSAATISKPIDLLFIGDGTYFGKMHKKTVAYLSQLSPATVKNVAVFSTYGGQDKVGADISNLLQKRGLTVVGKPFTCKGKAWGLINRKHPSKLDLENARAYAKDVAAALGQ